MSGRANDDSGPASATRTWTHAGPLVLDSGATLPEVRLAYRTWGTLDADGANAVLVEHALTGSADVDAWWGDLLGPGRALDPRRDFVVAANALGSCYGSTGPASPQPGSTSPWGPHFPALTVRDLVRAEAALVAALGVRRLRLVIGGSLGGMRALEWAASFPERVDAVAAIGAPARHSAWAIAWSEAARRALAADPDFAGGHYAPERPPRAGLAAARAVAMVSYRSPASLAERFDRAAAPDGGFAVAGWLGRHGERLVERFDANAWVTLTRAMDAHDLGAGRGGLARAAAAIERPVLFVAIASDVLYPPEEIAATAALFPHGELATLASRHGHDGFLVDAAEVERLVRSFRTRVDAGATPRGGRRPRVAA